MDKKNVSRTWTAEEANLFCEILTDPITNTMITLGQKALKTLPQKKRLRRNSTNLKGDC